MSWTFLGYKTRRFLNMVGLKGVIWLVVIGLVFFKKHGDTGQSGDGKGRRFFMKKVVATNFFLLSI